MSHPLAPYLQTPQLCSPLLLNPPDAIPPTDELEAVQAELRFLKQITLERAKKADGDLKAIEVAIKKMREREKGKAKAITKIKREPSYTPSLDHDDRAFSPPMSMPYKTPSSSSSIPTIAMSPPLAKAALEMRKMKKKDKEKKRKRDLEESDGDESQRPRKFSPLPPSQHKEPHQHKPSKLSNAHPKSTAPDWSLPPAHLQLPPRPAISPPPVPCPGRAIDVTEDFTTAKATSQVPITTFYASIEPWIRSIREEDLGWLEYTADEVEPYVIPKLGRHYSEVWEEEDYQLHGAVMDLTRGGPSHSLGASLPKWDPSTMTEVDLVVAERGHGPVTERLVSALLPAPQMSAWKNIKEAEDAYEAKSTASGSSLAKEKINVADFEERVKDTARFHGLLDRELDFSQALDDPISTALRQAQQQLRIVVATNKSRKARLADVARDRLAYQEYVELRDSIDKNIAATYAKLQKKDGPKVGKKKKKGEVNGVNGTTVSGPPLPNPASLGLGPDDEGKLFVPEALKSLVDTRRQWVDVIGGAFEDKQREAPGRIWGVPHNSVFAGIDEQVRRELHLGEGVGLRSAVTIERTDSASDRDGVNGTGG